MNKQYEYEQDKRPGGPAYESRELEDEMTYWDKMVESINQQTKEIKAFKKNLTNATDSDTLLSNEVRRKK